MPLGGYLILPSRFLHSCMQAQTHHKAHSTQQSVTRSHHTHAEMHETHPHTHEAGGQAASFVWSLKLSSILHAFCLLPLTDSAVLHDHLIVVRHATTTTALLLWLLLLLLLLCGGGLSPLDVGKSGDLVALLLVGQVDVTQLLGRLGKLLAVELQRFCFVEASEHFAAVTDGQLDARLGCHVLDHCTVPFGVLRVRDAHAAGELGFLLLGQRCHELSVLRLEFCLLLVLELDDHLLLVDLHRQRHQTHRH
mmetsp:Transcript_22092/g.54285  ORF Transcript_22092/g.54285 Transcript_22092/m.54285 type:complete len:250 (-) Transcript_22092:510-1259(-)